MFNDIEIETIFSDFIENGYSLFFNEREFFMLNKTLGIVIKFGCIGNEKAIGAGIIQCEPEQFTSKESLLSLNEFPFEFDCQVDINLFHSIGEALQSLHKGILKKHGRRIHDSSLIDTFNQYCMNLMALYQLVSDTKKYGVMSEKLYLWNENFGLIIERNYHDWHLGCAVFKYEKKDEYILPNKIIPLGMMFNDDKSKIAESNDLYDQGQKNYFSQLIDFLIAEKEMLFENVESDQFDWREVSGPAYELEKIKA